MRRHVPGAEPGGDDALVVGPGAQRAAVGRRQRRGRGGEQRAAQRPPGAAAAARAQHGRRRRARACAHTSPSTDALSSRPCYVSLLTPIMFVSSTPIRFGLWPFSMYRVCAYERN